MSGNDLAAAVAALITAGIILLNLGVQTIQAGDTPTGIVLILFGVALILAAVLVQKTMTQRMIRVAQLRDDPCIG